VRVRAQQAPRLADGELCLSDPKLVRSRFLPPDCWPQMHLVNDEALVDGSGTIDFTYATVAVD
jgi:hypothetical protein